jgi:hypothetical protein
VFETESTLLECGIEFNEAQRIKKPRIPVSGSFGKLSHLPFACDFVQVLAAMTAPGKSAVLVKSAFKARLAPME